MVVYIPAQQDRFNEQRELGISSVTFKIVAVDQADIFIIKNVFHTPGGPARHLHHHQDEWFYAVEGSFIAEVGDERFTLNTGDSLLAPRGIPHVWAYASNTSGRMLIVFLPPGNMETFFRISTQTNAMPAQDPALWREYGMELLAPPLAIE